MSGTIRGTDLNSWLRNRSARREEANQLVAQLRDAQARLASAAGNAPAPAAAPIAGESEAAILAQAENTLTALATAQSQLESISDNLQNEQQSLASTKDAVQRSAADRVRRESALAAQKKFESSQRWSEQGQKLRKFCAVVIFLGVIFVLLKY